MNITEFKWTRQPQDYKIESNRVEIITKPYTDLWQRTYYHFQNDNAPVFQMETEEKYFSFVVKTEFIESCHRFDQCGIVMYLDSENWLKASVEYENEEYQHLGSVVTNGGYSDWATTVIDASVKSMWYRFSRREDDYCIECSTDGINFKQMRICHMQKGDGTIQFGIYACSPEESSFKATFTNMQMLECRWNAHDGQQPDSK
ncbi:MAG: DUF1349 domain-containing protein [Lachnospiraceae bacterium]|nr:DUF1349 domain-containing protein [Lachnospiraceae bacterium]